jgi:predicted DNA-binding protein
MASQKRVRKQFNLNLPQEELDRLKNLSSERHVPMGNIVRFALDRLFDQLQGGQLNLPLGLDKRDSL